tara:strand:- start:55 stop:372 length:318 start_codon:yes stop_codon:yes gene_type:complete
MNNTIFKDKKRKESFLINDINNDCWKISLKYSQQLYNNIDKPDLYERSLICYHQFINEINSNKYPIKKRNYIQIWDTMINTSSKRLDRNKSSVKLLHQTNVQRNN